jgi:hypothetical protein
MRASMKPMRLLLPLLLATGTALADESRIQLRDAPGRDLVVANCRLCHSLDYIQMNSRFLERGGWEASVNKMVNVMGAPIKAEDVPSIVDYLNRAYGK